MFNLSPLLLILTMLKDISWENLGHGVTLLVFTNRKQPLWVTMMELLIYLLLMAHSWKYLR